MKVIQSATRFSESRMWEMQLEAYSDFGPRAWIEKSVPFYLTQHPLTAKLYAQIILAFLKEGVDSSKPVYLLDLGAGIGKLGYYIMRELEKEPYDLRYVMTDISEPTIEYWQKHPYLKESCFDFAYYTAGQKEPLELIRSNQVLDRLDNPPILICNYFFDTIPQDLFRLNRGVLEEGRVELDVEGKESIKNLQYKFSYHPANKNYYQDPDLQRLLNAYCELFSDSTFLLPTKPIEVIQDYSKLADGRLMVISGDQGVVTEEQVKHWGDPTISEHDTFSVPVSYHALKLFFEQNGGVGFCSSVPDPKFVNLVGIFGNGEFKKTKNAFAQGLDAFGPCEFWRLSEKKLGNLEEVLSMLKLGCWDPVLLYHEFSNIQQLLPKATIDQKQRLKFAINCCIKNFYPTCEAEKPFIEQLYQLRQNL